MAIVAVKQKWSLTVYKEDDDKTVNLSINEDATVRTLFKEVRKEFKARTAIRLYNQSNTEIAKSDRTMKDVGITNGARLRVTVHPSNPEVFTIFVTLPNGTHISLNLAEKQFTSELYKQVKQKMNPDKEFRLKHGVTTIPNDGTTLYASVFDGVQLVANIPVMINIIVNIQKDAITVLLPEDATSADLYKEIRQKKPSLNNAPLRVLDGTHEIKENSTPLTDFSIANNSQVFVVMETKGGSDPRVQMLHSCPNKDVVGVSTPSIRACPFCGALVQHIEACKHMNCPACSKEFCFICLKKREGRWQCGSYDSKCTPAPRQTHIPG